METLPNRERNKYYEQAYAVWTTCSLTDARDWKKNMFTRSVRDYIKGSQLEKMESWIDGKEQDSEFVRGGLAVAEELIEAIDNIVQLVKDEQDHIEQLRNEEEYESEGGRISSYS